MQILGAACTIDSKLITFSAHTLSYRSVWEAWKKGWLSRALSRVSLRVDSSSHWQRTISERCWKRVVNGG